jgi:hypothetical protein
MPAPLARQGPVPELTYSDKQTIWNHIPAISGFTERAVMATIIAAVAALFAARNPGLAPMALGSEATSDLTLKRTQRLRSADLSPSARSVRNTRVISSRRSQLSELLVVARDSG